MQAPYLTCHDLSAAYDSAILFSHLSFAVHPGERWGIVGPNGAGKSTLFKLIKGTLLPTEGTIALKQDVRIAFIDQKINFDENATVEQILRNNLPLVYDTDRQIALLEQDVHTVSTLIEQNPTSLQFEKWMHKISELHTKIDEISGTSTDNIIQSALQLGILTDISERAFGELSGGQQKRVQIIAALLTNPNLILLDEPTNHLDVQTVEWLEEFLLKIAEDGFSAFGFNSAQDSPEPVAFIIISHDRALLDTLVNKILEIEHGSAKKYDGNYELYNEQKIHYLITEEKKRLKMANTMRRELEWLRDGVRARTTKQSARIKRAHELDKNLQDKNERAALNRNADFSFSALMVDELRDKDNEIIVSHMNLGQQELVKCEDVSIAHPADTSGVRLIFKNLNFIIKPGIRLALLGPNGCGKSTLLKYIAQRKPPFSGKIKYHDLCAITYFDQTRDMLDYDDTVKNNIQTSGDHVLFSGKHIHIMSYLERFLFTQEERNRVVSSLSGGEQARLLLAKLMLDQGNLLILDEPTNDLDIPTLQVLEKNLADFEGGVIFTSHDRYFMQKVATSILTFTGEKNNISQWTFFPDLNQALDHLEKIEDARQEQNKKLLKTAQKKEQTSRTFMGVPKKESSSKKLREISLLENRISEIEQILSNLNAELEQLYSDQKHYQETILITKQIKDLKLELDEAYQKLEQLI